MRRSVLAALLLPAISLTATNALAGPVRSSAPNSLTPEQMNGAYRETLKSIRAAALRQQASDGGVLTAEHQAALQARLDDANNLHHRQLANNNPLTVDADGHPNKVAAENDWTWSRLMREGGLE